MEFVTVQTYLGDILRVVSDALLAPDIVLLLGFIVYAVFCIGSIIVETITEHRNFKVHMPEFLAALADADQDDMPVAIEKSGLLNRQKIALLTVFDYRTLPGDMLIALVKRLLNDEELHYQRIVNRNNVAVRVAPMLGLMGTLIPLGPGIAALGQGDVTSLSSSLIIAFNTTVAGLAAAAVCLVIARIRKTWYNSYMNALESAMASMLHKIGALQDRGAISVKEPGNSAFLFKKALKRKAAKGTAGEASKGDRRKASGQDRPSKQPGTQPVQQPGTQPVQQPTPEASGALVWGTQPAAAQPMDASKQEAWYTHNPAAATQPVNAEIATAWNASNRYATAQTASTLPANIQPTDAQTASAQFPARATAVGQSVANQPQVVHPYGSYGFGSQSVAQPQRSAAGSMVANVGVPPAASIQARRAELPEETQDQR